MGNKKVEGTRDNQKDPSVLSVSSLKAWESCSNPWIEIERDGSYTRTQNQGDGMIFLANKTRIL